MTVEQCIVTKTGSVHAITERVQLACEVIETVGTDQTKIRILEAGAGLAVNDEITVPTVKLTEP